MQRKISILNINPNDFQLRNYWYSSAEAKIYNYLTRIISHEYIILPHVSLRDLFLCKEQRKTLDISLSHLDFVIFDKKFLPIFAMEVNGKAHKSALCKLKDKRKQDLLNTFHIPLLTIDLSIFCSDKELQEKIHQKLFPRFGDKGSYPVYCWSCKNPMLYQLRKDGTDAFFYCKKCQSKKDSTKNKSISIKYIPTLLQEDVL